MANGGAWGVRNKGGGSYNPDCDCCEDYPDCQHVETEEEFAERRAELIRLNSTEQCPWCGIHHVTKEQVGNRLIFMFLLFPIWLLIVYPFKLGCNE